MVELEFMGLQFRGAGYRANGMFFVWWPFMLLYGKQLVNYISASGNRDQVANYAEGFVL